jgi:Tol biopolymer transport system component/DNA-binding winged helix-turn-helix (wHTH) protein
VTAQPSSAQVVSFGLFTADLRCGELYKNGIKVKLERQPFQVLSILLEHPGELVSREELRNRVWPQDTFVDFDHALNTAITKIRVAVGDDADNPRFVETVPRRGYRFVASVNGTTGKTGSGVKSASAIRKTVVFVAIGIVLVVLGGFSLFWLRSPVPPPRVAKYTQLTSDGRYKGDLFTDGSRLYFTVAESGRLTLAQMSAAGGQVSPVSVPFEQVGLSDISPDGASLLVHAYAADQDVDDSKAAYVLPLPVGTPRRLGSNALLEATWSPDGRWLAYREGTDLWVAESDGSAPRKLATLQGPPLSLQWSPDGKLLRFFVWMGLGNHSLWEVHSDGSHLHQLFPGWNNPPAECCGKWTPDGRYFIFMSSRGEASKGESASNLWAVREQDEYFRRVSHEPVRLTLTSTGTAQIISAVPSRDGKRLFVISGNERYELVRYDKASRSFLAYLPGVNGVKFSFSKDGLWVSYVNIADNTLWRSRVDGSERLQLTFPPMNANFIPSWSPDGSQIAFAASLPGRPVQIFRISRDGGSPEQLTEGKHRDGDVRPSWSPDGKTLMFGEYPGEFPDSAVPAKISPMYVWLLDLQRRKLTTLPGSADLFRPAWSPDGRHISAYSVGGDVLVFDFATQKWTEVIRPPNEWCAWSHDGRYIQCGFVVKGEEVVQRVRVSDHKVELVASLKNLVRVGFSGINTWLGAAPDDSPLANRNVSSYDIYALDWELP